MAVLRVAVVVVDRGGAVVALLPPVFAQRSAGNKGDTNRGMMALRTAVGSEAGRN